MDLVLKMHELFIYSPRNLMYIFNPATNRVKQFDEFECGTLPFWNIGNTAYRSLPARPLCIIIYKRSLRSL